MIQWKQRLYAFLLRRLLGPILDPSSIQKLHDSIDVSLNEGRFTLNDILLNAEYLTNLAASSSSGVIIRNARIEQLEIFLTLRENDYSKKNSNAGHNHHRKTSSLTWRAIKLGTSNADLPAVSIIAEIKVTGVFIELAPAKVRKTTRQQPSSSSTTRISSVKDEEEEKKQDETAKSNSVIGSYVDAALNSLQLNLKMNNVNVKLCSGPTTCSSPSSKESSAITESWVELCLSSASYKDLETRTASGNPSEYKTLFHKVIDFSGLTIRAAEESSSAPVVSTIANVQGTGQIFVRAVEYLTSYDSITEQEKRIQQDVEIKLNQQINMQVDVTSIVVLGSVAEGFSREPLEEVILSDDLNLQMLEQADHVLQMDDQEDLKALTGIMKQYQEAYHSAEHQDQLKGGILVPTNAYEEGLQIEDEDDGTFDIFFDANDQSLMKFASVMHESMLHTPDKKSDISDFVHTKLRLHLLQGSLKVNFRDLHQNSSIVGNDEYILLSFDDMNLSSSTSARNSDMSLSIAHLEVEDSQLDGEAATNEFISVGGVQSRRAEIGNLIRFISVSTYIYAISFFCFLRITVFFECDD